MNERSPNKGLMIVAALLLVGGGVWWVSQKSAEKAPTAAAGKMAAKPANVPVVVAQAARRDVPVSVKLAATVYANATVTVKSRMDSQIVAVHFQDGDKVRQGDLLFELDNRALKAQRAELQANLQRDTVQLKNAKLQYERSKKLITQGFVTNEKLDQDKTTYEAQEASLAATKATLENIDVQMDYTLVRAPISGRAGTITVTAGNTVKANDTTGLVTINQIDPILVQFSVPQRYYDSVRAAMARGKLGVNATRAETGATLIGNLEYIDNAIDLGTGTFVARARFDNPDEKLWPGMFVDVLLTLDTLKDVLVIPAAALQGKEGQQFVYVANAAKQAEKRAVTARLLEDNAVIETGLQPGDQVVTDGLLRVSEGAALEIAQPKPTTPAVDGVAKGAP